MRRQLSKRATPSFSTILDLLRSQYGKPDNDLLPLGNYRDPTDELIFISLSQRTHAQGTQRAFDELKRRFGTWEDVARASVEEIELATNAGGLSFLKAPRVKRMLQVLLDTTGSCGLGFLRDMPDAGAYGYLTKTLGAGPKTAWCVLLYSLNRDVFPADVHAIRVLTRLGLLPTQLRHESLNRHIHEYVPMGNRFELHVNLIEHGRKTCRQRPRCSDCVLLEICAYGNERVNQEPSPAISS